MTCKKTFLKTQDEKNLLYRVWKCYENTRGVICIVHGLGEHSGRYKYVAEVFIQSGYSVIGFDLRGHGESWGKRGHIDSYDTLLNDIDFIINEAKSIFPNQPIFLLGHSMGGNLVLNYTLRREHNLQGTIALSPWLSLINPPSKLLILATHLLDKICPSITVSNGISPDELSQVNKNNNEYKRDDLNHDRISFRLFANMYRSGKWALENANKLRTPLLLMHGSHDKVTSFESSKKFANFSGSNCTFISWYGLYHELLNEVKKEQIFESIIKWIDNFSK